MKWWAIFFISLFLLQKVFSQSNFTYHIKSYGAKGDGKTLSTNFIQKAIDEAFTAGGGKVIIEPGIYISGTIFLKSNVHLEIMAGAIIKGSDKISDYTPMKWGHNKDRQPYHLLVANNANNIKISGMGTIDGNGPAFWQPRNEKDDPQWIMAKDQKISPMLEIWNCRNVDISEVTLITGGGWTLHLYDSDLIKVSGIKILNNLFSPNGDGIDISGCSDVVISDCIIKTCDDAICLKTMGDSKECKRVTVNNCVIECSCAALKIGNESFRDISQVTFSNCVISNSNRAIGIYAEGAGHISDVIISNIVCDTKAPFIYNRPIHISLLQKVSANGGVYGGEIENTEKYFNHEGRQAQMRNVFISNFKATSEGRILITAEKGKMIQNLTLRDITIEYPYIEDPVPCVDSIRSAQFSPKNPDAKRARAAMVVENVENLVVDNFNIIWPTEIETPKEWQIKKRIANGTLNFFYPIYEKARQTEMHAFWGRGLKGGYYWAPLAKASHPSFSNLDLSDCSLILHTR